jgi:protoporphyrinogen oxidase
VSVVVFNVGVAGACPVDDHWIYYPEPALPFYRVGFPSNFSDGVAPPGTYAMYVELSVAGARGEDLPALWPAVRDGLARAGLVRPDARLLAQAPVLIPCGYVIYDAHRREAVPRLLAALAAHGVISTGRYGAWEYGSMETAIGQGLAAARQLVA